MTWKPTEFRGVRYREHPNRKHGILKDRYYTIRYMRNGETHEEGVGWGSLDKKENGPLKSLRTLTELKDAPGKEKPTRLSEERQAEKDRREAEKVRRENEALEKARQRERRPDLRPILHPDLFA